MPETTVDISKINDLLENLFTGVRPTTKNSNSTIMDINSIHFEISDEESEYSGTFSFHEMLGQHITNQTVQDTPNSEKANNPSSELSTAKLLEEDINEINPSISQEPLMIESSQRNEENTSTSSSSKEELGGSFSSIKKSEAGFEWAFPSKQILNTSKSADISSSIFVKHQEPSIQIFGQNPSLKNSIVGDTINLSMHNPSILKSDNKNPFTSLPTKEEQIEIDMQQNRQSIHMKNPGFLFHTETPPLQNLITRNALSNLDNVGLNPSNNIENLQKFDQPISSTAREPEFVSTDFDTTNIRKLQNLDHFISNKTQEPAFTGSDLDTVNIRELPETFKLSSQPLSTDTKQIPLIHEIVNPIHATERPIENGLTKINNNESSKHDIINTLQTDEEWNLSDNPSQKQNSFNAMSFDILSQKTDSKYHFSLDTQTTPYGIQSNPTAFQQDAALFPGSSTTQSFSNETHEDTVSHRLHRNFTAGTEYTHNNIVEQLFQKIRLINHGERSEIKLHLTPPELGSVKIHFIEENDEIEAKIFVENVEVKAAIENNVHRLKESVATSGMEIHKLEVYIQNDTANKQNLLEDSDTNNPQYQTKSRGNRNEDRTVNENAISNNLQTEAIINTSNLLVDYII